MRRLFGEVRVSLLVDPGIYPGAEGTCESRSLTFERRQGPRWAPATISELPPTLFSEACRAVDLLVSVTTMAIEDESLPETRPVVSHHKTMPGTEPTPTAMARMRHEVLRRAFAALAAEGRVSLEQRHLRIGDHAIHLSTGRVTRLGAPVSLALPPGPHLYAVPWLPYDEKLLQKIVSTASVLLER